jgi:predicted CXXCH cytochrome family protein
MNAPGPVLWGAAAAMWLGLAITLIAADAPGDAAPKNAPFGPDTVLLNELENEYQPVPFSHAIHAEMAEMWDGCVTCHHRPPEPGAHGVSDDQPHTQAESDQIPSCKSCHPIGADNTDIRKPGLKGAYHRQCLNCHKAWSGENGCVICHEAKGNGHTSTPPTPGDIVGRMHPPIETPTTVDFIARYTPAPGPNVTFRHDEHVESYGLQCVHCHQRDTCSDCHSDDASEQRKHKPVEPAMSWQTSHGPCMTCHQSQACSHCHYADGDDAPPPFDHTITGQHLDDDHADLTCAQCHHNFDFTIDPTCGDSTCHGEGTFVSLPDDRPGPFVDTVRDERASKTWASLHPRPLRAEGMIADSHLIARPGDRQVRVPQRTGDTPLPPMPQTGDQTCVTAECHVAVKSYTHVHGPVNVNACDVCHELVDEEAHEFTVLREGKELCTYCHEFQTGDAPLVHEPVKTEQCLGCHNPHGGPTRHMTREASIAQMCGRCHEPVTPHLAFLHTPVRDGECVSCHSPHGSQLPNLLDLAGADLCLACHDNFATQLTEASFTHKAMDEQCTACHGSHGGSEAMSLKEPAPQLCFTCHDETRQQVMGAAVSHDTAVMQGQSCLNCHTPHGGNLAALMRDEPAELCLDCHVEPIDANGRTVASLASLDDPAVHAHGPIADGQCSGCHQPHGSAHRDLLTKPYEQDLYREFSIDQYAFCFQCHDPMLAIQPAEEGQPTTSFRNGALNLHAVHVNDRWGRACFACHETHGSTNPRLMRTSMQFREWQAPIGFQPTDTGGYCASGCHTPFSYDRDNPVPLDDQINRDAPPMIRVRHDTGDAINITLTDVAGSPLSIPDDGHVTVVIAMRGDEHRPDRAAAPLAGALEANPDLPVVLLVVGPDAAAQGQSIMASHDVDWRLVADEDHAVSRELQVRAWPTVLLIRPDGREMARIGGTPVAAAIRLRGYLDALAGSPAHPAVTTITDRAARDAAWYLDLATQLRKQGDTPRAEQVLSEALKLHPDRDELKLALAEAKLQLDRPDAALEQIATVPRSAAADVLAARALIAMGRWDEAAPLVAAVLAAAPDHRDALFLQGRLREHAGDWQQAAEAYRRANPAP